ncbi:MAG: hypothetical protein MZW92_48075 [Comamonadaceae bacterium]|nr:hypothetical protein [Comamonadaceae bacterium]
MKGDFRWGKDVVPGVPVVQRLGRPRPHGREDRPGFNMVHLSYPKGSRSGAGSLITPFKRMVGKQPYDVGHQRDRHAAPVRHGRLLGDL